MDVSGSMGDEQKEMVRIASFWIDTWLSRNTKTWRVATSFTTPSARGGRTHVLSHARKRRHKISAAYRVLDSIIDERFPPSEWNIYAFHFSDGDNWDDDNHACAELMQESLLPKLNQFCYGQVASYWGSGKFLSELYDKFEDNDKVVTSEISDREDILKAIKSFLGKGDSL
jgi:uncharacterized sporulation protein YeaH/YhbH (DUF444 family)